jgi:hypothetical protein
MKWLIQGLCSNPTSVKKLFAALRFGLMGILSMILSIVEITGPLDPSCATLKHVPLVRLDEEAKLHKLLLGQSADLAPLLEKVGEVIDKVQLAQEVISWILCQLHMPLEVPEHRGVRLKYLILDPGPDGVAKEELGPQRVREFGIEPLDIPVLRIFDGRLLSRSELALGLIWYFNRLE